jgi:hypothetical protein
MQPLTVGFWRNKYPAHCGRKEGKQARDVLYTLLIISTLSSRRKIQADMCPRVLTPTPIYAIHRPSSSIPKTTLFTSSGFMLQFPLPLSIHLLFLTRPIYIPPPRLHNCTLYHPQNRFHNPYFQLQLDVSLQVRILLKQILYTFLHFGVSVQWEERWSRTGVGIWV